MPTLLFQHNVEAMIWRRHYEVQTNPLKKAYLYGQWRKAFRYERAACRRFDMVVTVSRDDAETIRHDYGVETVADVPTGVDTEFFRPAGGAETRAARPRLHRLDGLAAERGRDTVLHARDSAACARACAGRTLTVVGREPYASLVELAKRDPGIVVTGRVEDVRPYMERAAAYVVPIRVGGGTRLKIYEAMAMEKPVVSTTVGAEGLPLRDGEDLLLADTPRAFADAVVSVLTDAGLARRLGTRAAERVREQFGWDKVAAVFAEHCARAAAAAQGREVLKNEILAAGSQG